MKKIPVLVILLTAMISLSSCGGGFFKRSDVKDNPVRADARVKKNLEEGRGISFGKLTGKGSGKFDFASSNELWRASIDTLDFVTFANASYSGGILITDWFNSNSKKDNELNRELKITVRFMTNEIRADAIKVIVFEKLCMQNNNCKTKKIKSKLESEIKLAILKKAALFERDDFKKYKETEGKKRGVGLIKKR